MNQMEMQLLIKEEIQKIEIQLNQLKRKQRKNVAQAHKAFISLKKLTMEFYLSIDSNHLLNLYSTFLSETDVTKYLMIRQKLLNEVAEIKQTTNCYEFKNDRRYRQLKALYQNTILEQIEREYEHYQLLAEQEQLLQREQTDFLMIQQKKLEKLLYKLEHLTEKNIASVNAQLEQNQFPAITEFVKTQTEPKRKTKEIDHPSISQTLPTDTNQQRNTIILLPSSPDKSYLQNDITKFTEEQLLDLNNLIEQIIQNHFSHNKQQHKKFTDQIFVMKKGTLRLFYTQWERGCYVPLYCQIKKTQRVNNITKRLHRRISPLNILKTQIPNPLENREFMKQQKIICDNLKQKLLSKKITSAI